MHEHLAGFTGTEGVLFIGRAQEKTSLFRTERRRDAAGDSYPWIVRATGVVNQFDGKGRRPRHRLCTGRVRVSRIAIANPCA